MSKILSSTAKIRFQDCDPFRHLNNARYVDYMLNAREDQVAEAYGLHLFELATKKLEGWVVSTSKTSFFRPALPGEMVVLESQTIAFSDKDLEVEFRMYDKERSKLKAFVWMKFVFIDLKTGKVKPHGDDLMKIFESAHLPVEQKDFESRRLAFRTT